MGRLALIAIVATMIGAGVFGTSGAMAATSEWVDVGGGRVRMAAALDPATNRVAGVVEVALADGWKTYWREPGDSGIPPIFEFAASQNFAVGDIRYPVPERVEQGGGAFAGYHGRVLFAFDGAARGDDGTIDLQLALGVCDEICIPAAAAMSIPLSALRSSDPEASRLIAEAERRMPAPPREGLRIESLEIVSDNLLEARAIVSGAGEPQLFAVGPADWRMSPGRLVARDGGSATFRIPLWVVGRGKPESGSTLRLTLVQNGQGIEQEIVAGR